jgi:peptidoglycan/xylan/chitin deacetylase (PgdA/CDA1 family)
VQPGDTLWAISKRYGVSLEAIMKANELKDSEFILVGQELVIPLVTPVVSPSPTLTPSTQPVQATKVPIPTSPPVEAELIRHGDRSNPLIALTFDACQREGEVTGYDVAIIRILTETQTAATLFLGGLWMQSHPEETKLLADVPFFELGNHSWSHKDFSAIPVEVMMEEITRTQEIMYQLTGQQPTLFRFPYGTYTDEALRVVAQLGLKAIQWDVVTGDPDPKVSAEDIIREVMAKAQNGSIVIMHMNARGWHTAEALPTLIEKLSEKGFKFVTVSQLLEE